MTDPFGATPLDHLRRTLPPWHTGPEMTECGRPVGDVKSIIDKAEMKAKVTRLGIQRASYTLCMSCANLFSRPAEWARHPADITQRWVESMRYRARDTDEQRGRVNRELLALGMLVEEHRDEYLRLVAALAETTVLDDARRRARLRPVRDQP